MQVLAAPSSPGFGQLVARRQLLPLAPHAVVIQHGIHADDWHLLDLRLSDDEAVEWVAVVERQHAHLPKMAQRDAQNLDAIDLKLMRESFSKGWLRFDLPMLNLIAISHRLAMLTRSSFSSSSISARAWVLS